MVEIRKQFVRYLRLKSKFRNFQFSEVSSINLGNLLLTLSKLRNSGIPYCLGLGLSMCVGYHRVVVLRYNVK